TPCCGRSSVSTSASRVGQAFLAPEGVEMATWVWIIIAVVAAIVLLGVVLNAARARRTRALQERFGSEYDRTLDQAGGRRGAERELRDREKRHEDRKSTRLNSSH